MQESHPKKGNTSAAGNLVGVRLRPATVADMPAVHQLVYELAEYEKEPHAVVTTPDEYATDFKNGLFSCIVAESESGEVVGMVLFFMAYSTWKGKMLYLDDFVVKSNWRGMGIGQQLYEAFLAEAARRGCRLAKWQVLDWNQPAIRFYEKNNAIVERGWWNVKKIVSAS